MRASRRILQQSMTIAVVGASSNAYKTAHAVPLQIKRYGWRVIPVNLHAEMIFGERCYRRLADIEEPIDLVNVFRPSDQATDVVRDAISVGARAVWLQLGITSAEGRRLAVEAGLDYVEDECIAVVQAAFDIRPPAPGQSPSA